MKTGEAWWAHMIHVYTESASKDLAMTKPCPTCWELMDIFRVTLEILKISI
jgi:hypothetical protein